MQQRNHPPSRLRLPDYYLIEGANSFAMALLTLTIFFWTRARFDFSNTENLLLNAASGLAYVPGALYGGRLADRFGYERLLRLCMLCLIALTLTAWLVPWRGAPYILLALYSLFAAPLWPCLEGALLHAAGSLTTPRRVGWYNVCWSLPAAVAFFLSGALFAWRRDAVVWLPGLVHLAALTWQSFPRGPGSAAGGVQAMHIPHASDHIPRHTKQTFMRLGWIANSLGYLLFGVMSALTPYLSDRLNLPPVRAIWLASTLLFARTAAFVLFSLWEGWHYRTLWAQLSLWVPPVMCLTAFSVQSPALVVAALGIFGAAFGLAYSSSIYYSLDYGEQKGEHGGLHEAILGVGILVGPLIGALGARLFHGAHGAIWLAVGVALAADSAVTMAVRRGKRAVGE